MYIGRRQFMIIEFLEKHRAHGAQELMYVDEVMNIYTNTRAIPFAFS